MNAVTMPLAAKGTEMSSCGINLVARIAEEGLLTPILEKCPLSVPEEVFVFVFVFVLFCFVCCFCCFCCFCVFCVFCVLFVCLFLFVYLFPSSNRHCQWLALLTVRKHKSRKEVAEKETSDCVDNKTNQPTKNVIKKNNNKKTGRKK